MSFIDSMFESKCKQLCEMLNRLDTLEEQLDKAGAELPTDEEQMQFRIKEEQTANVKHRTYSDGIAVGIEWYEEKASSIIAAKNHALLLCMAENDSLISRNAEQESEIEVLKAAMQEFVDRVDKGEVRSTKTYNKFKALLNPNGDNN
jgi:uncharacterized coiled-coil protein SlyX